MQPPELWPEASCGGSCLSSGHEGRHRQEHSKDQVQSGQQTTFQANQENKNKTKSVPSNSALGLAMPSGRGFNMPWAQSPALQKIQTKHLL